MKTETLKIEGMTCGHCVKAVREALDGLPGVRVEDVEIGSARVSYEDDQIDHGKLVDAIEEEGYTVK